MVPAEQTLPPGELVWRARRVLVVEDEALIRFVAADHLRSLGFDVLEAGNGDEACVALKSFRVDLVLCDYRMPGSKDGLAVARWIDQNVPGLPMVLITANPPAPDPTLRCVLWPALPKPYRLAQLSERIAAALPGD